MSSDLESRLLAYATVILRVGVNLQPGQPLLIAEPYELQGVSPDAADLVEAISSAAMARGTPRPTIIWGDAPGLRRCAEQSDWRGFTRLVAANAALMEHHLAAGGAFLFPLVGSSGLMAGIPAERVSQLQQIAWEHFGPIIQRLTRGESQWTLVPAATPAWAKNVFPGQPAAERSTALQDTLSAALRIDRLNFDPDQAFSAWQDHLGSLNRRRDELNARGHQSLRYHGPGTDLTVKLPTQHRWCTAQLSTKGGISFVANLPTEEVFTAPDCNSAEGTVRVSRPVNCSGMVIEGIELEFRGGRVVEARASAGADLLLRLLETDDGACRLGEVALVAANQSESSPAEAGNWRNAAPLFHHALFDENVSHHIALGESYSFCSRSLFGLGLNRSLIHVDLPLAAQVTLT